MANYEAWKLTVDVFLALSLLFLCFRFFRSGMSKAHTKKGLELEDTLRRLIQDAEAAGKALNDELYKRQIALERALSNIEQAELKVRDATFLADEKCSELASVASRAGSRNESTRRSQDDTQERKPISRAPLSRRVEIERPKTPEFVEVINNSSDGRSLSTRTESVNESQGPRKAPPTVGNPARSQAVDARRAYAAAQRPLARPGTDTSSNVNDSHIAWLTEETDRIVIPTAKNQSLRHSLEVEVEDQPISQSSPIARITTLNSLEGRLQAAMNSNQVVTPAEGQKIVEDMEKIYRLAEQLLRTGKDVESVAAQTKLPLRRVKAISEMVTRERDYGFEEEEAESGKKMLGALQQSKRGGSRFDGV